MPLVHFDSTQNGGQRGPYRPLVRIMVLLIAVDFGCGGSEAGNPDAAAHLSSKDAADSVARDADVLAADTGRVDEADSTADSGGLADGEARDAFTQDAACRHDASISITPLGECCATQSDCQVSFPYTDCCLANICSYCGMK